MQTYFFVLIIALQAVNLACQSPPKDDGDSFSKVLLKLDEILQTEKENAALFSKLLSEQSVEIQKIQENYKKEEASNRNVYSRRLFLESAGLKLEPLLMSAVERNDASQVQVLLDLGALIEYEDPKKNRPIHVAVLNRYVRVLEVLLNNNVDIESKGENQLTALHVAGRSLCLECAKLLINKGANLESRDEWLNTPIIHPARVAFNDFVELMLKKGANVNAGQFSDTTGLHWAAIEGHLSTVKLLVKYGADIRLKNREGKTPLDLAVITNHKMVIEFLQNLSDKYAII